MFNLNFIVCLILSGLESDQDFGQCKSLVSLNIKGTTVTTIGTRLAMEHLPKLQFLNCPYTLHVAAQMFKERESTSVDNEFRQLPLMELCYSRSGEDSIPYEEGDLEAALEICPSVVCLKIREWGTSEGMFFTDKELKYLLNLKNLRRLTLQDTDRVTFKGGLLPILEKFGPSTLEKLRLTHFPELDISAIAKYCSNLRYLVLWNIERFISPSRALKPEENRLQRLECLQIAAWGKIFPVYTATDMLILLSSPALVTIYFLGLGIGLSDQVMEEVVHLYGFPNLQEFIMHYCKGVTTRSIDCLLTLDNPLKKIGFRTIEGSEEDQEENWESQINKNNWDLTIN